MQWACAAIRRRRAGFWLGQRAGGMAIVHAPHSLHALIPWTLVCPHDLVQGGAGGVEQVQTPPHRRRGGASTAAGRCERAAARDWRLERREARFFRAVRVAGGGWVEKMG